MEFALILTVLAFSVDGAAWGEYVKPGSVKEDGKFKNYTDNEETVYYYEKGHGCHKGYDQVAGTGAEYDANNECIKDCTCKKCKDYKPEDVGGYEDASPWGPIACKDYKGSDEDAYIGCYCKDKKWVAGSCPAVAKRQDLVCKKDVNKKDCEDEVKKIKAHKKYATYKATQCAFQGCMPYNSKGRCSGMAVWAFILIIVLAFLVVVAIVVVVIVIILKLKSKPATKVDPIPAAAESKAVEAPPPEVVGPSVLIKLGKQEIRTKKTADGPEAVWGEAVVFTGLGAEDDDVIIEVNGNDGEVLGTAEQRIPEYVNNKKRAVLTLKNGEADAGVLEVDIEIQVQEEPEVKITGVFFVDKYTKPVPV